MNKLSKNKKRALYYILVLVLLWILVYICFAFVLAEINPFKWEQSIRGIYVFGILAISFPISQIIKSELD